MQALLEFIKKLQSDKRFASFDEVAIKQGIVLKILSLLGWDPFDVDEINPEYGKDDKRVDFSLRVNNSNAIFIVIEKEGKNSKNSREQLIYFAAKEDVKIAILTNGLTWWFFSPHLGRNSEEKNFLKIQMYEQKADQAAQRFMELLSKQNVISGKAAESAKSMYQAKQKAVLIHEYLPKAWQEITSEPEKWLVDVVIKVTEGLCGYKPDNETVKKFLSSGIALDLKGTPLVKPGPPSKQQEKGSLQEAYTGKSIRSFKFREKKYAAKTWKDMLLKICELMNQEHKDKFEFLIDLYGQEEQVFSRNGDKILIAEKISGTDIYVNSGLTPKATLALCHEIISACGYTEGDLSIETG
jgi:predicted type IV restriction endonuclease